MISFCFTSGFAIPADFITSNKRSWSIVLVDFYLAKASSGAIADASGDLRSCWSDFRSMLC